MITGTSPVIHESRLKPKLPASYKGKANNKNSFQQVLNDKLVAAEASMRGIVLDHKPYIITMLGEHVPLIEIAKYE